MAREPRPDFSDCIVHVVNRSAHRERIFFEDDDYLGLIGILIEARGKVPIRLLGFCLMPNHVHFLLWPRSTSELVSFMHLVTSTHARRWRKTHGTSGLGHVYQGRYRASIVQPEELHVHRCLRYVERNALRANLVEHAVDWRWGSLWLRKHGDQHALLSPCPFPLPGDWQAAVDEAQNPAELDAIRRATRRGAPIGSDKWVEDTARRLGLEHTLRRRGGQPRRL